MKKLILWAFIFVAASGSAWCKGPGCGNLNPPILGGPGCGGHRGPGCGGHSIHTAVFDVDAAWTAVQRAKTYAKDNGKKVAEVPVELAGILTIMPYGDEPSCGKNASVEDRIKAKQTYWDLQALVLNAEADRFYQESDDAKDKGDFSAALKAATSSAKFRGAAKTAEAIVSDCKADAAYADVTAKKDESPERLIKRKKTLFASLSGGK